MGHPLFIIRLAVNYFVDPIVTTQRSSNNMLISIGVGVAFISYFSILYFSFGYSCRSASENRFHHLMRTEATGVAQVAAATIAVVETRTEALNPAALIIILAAMTTPMMTTPSRHQQLQIQAGQHHRYHLLAIYNVCQRETGAPSEFTTL